MLKIKGFLYLIFTPFYSFILLTVLAVKLLWIWLTLAWKIHKVRKHFEKELMEYGISKNDAKRISAQYTMLKDDLKRVFQEVAI